MGMIYVSSSASTQSMVRLLTAAIAVLILGHADAARAAAIVTRVWDGDTVSVRRDDQELRVRLAGIDAPEHDQPHGDAAATRLNALLLGREVRLEDGKVDRYGRLVAKVWVQPPDCPTCGKTLDAGLAQLTAGHAWWYRRYRDDQSPEDRGRYEFAEREARARRAGLWAEPDPTPPWNWPRTQR